MGTLSMRRLVTVGSQRDTSFLCSRVGKRTGSKYEIYGQIGSALLADRQTDQTTGVVMYHWTRN
jgi:hypothetical protein